MTYYQMLISHFTAPQVLEFLLRIIVACVCGAVVGLERSKRFKEAGIRTHVIVACASAVMMLVSKYAFADLTWVSAGDAAMAGIKGADASRIASQVVSGISFLGAGVIFKNGSSVKGLTTAAGLWAVAGIGLAIGGGMYIVGIFATVVMTVFQMVMHKFNVGHDIFEVHRIAVVVRGNEDFATTLKTQVKKWHGMIQESKIKKNAEKGSITYTCLVKVPAGSLTFEDLQAFTMQYEEVESAEKLMIGG